MDSYLRKPPKNIFGVMIFSGRKWATKCHLISDLITYKGKKLNFFKYYRVINQMNRLGSLMIKYKLVYQNIEKCQSYEQKLF